MPSSIKRAEEFGDQLQTIFVESQGHTMADALTMAYDRGWMGTNAAWTIERVCSSGSGTLPSFVLISSEGKVLMKGNPLAMHSKIEDAIRADIEAAGAGPAEAPKAVRDAYSQFAKGKWAKAIEAAQKLAAAGGEDGSAAEQALRSFEQRIAAELKQAGAMIEQGLLIQADARVSALAKQLKGSEQAAQVAELEAQISSPENKDEYAADKAFQKLHEKLNDKGLDDNAGQLEKFIDKHEGSKAAARAAALLELAKA